MILGNVIGDADYHGMIKKLNGSGYDQNKCLVEKLDKQDQRVERKLIYS